MSDEIAEPAEEPTSPEATEEQPVEVADEPEANEEEVKPQTKLDKLIASKYGGDPDKFADALYEQWNSSSKLHQSNSELRQMLEELSSKLTKPAESNVFEDHPDYQWLKSEVSALEEDKAENAEIRKHCIAEYNALQTQLAVAKATGSSPQDIRDLQREMNQLADRYKASERDDKRLEREKVRLDRQLKQAEQLIQSSKVKQQQTEQQTQAEIQSYRAQFDSVVNGLLADSGLPEDEQADLYEVIRLQANNYIDKNGEVPDIGKLGAEIATRHLERIKRQNFKTLSTTKLQTPAPKPQSKPTAAAPKPKPQSKPSQPGHNSLEDAKAAIEAFTYGIGQKR